MKLSDYAKLNGVTYRTAWNWFKSGQIPNAKQLETGTIIVPVTSTQKTNGETVVYGRVSNISRKLELNYQIDRCLEFARAKGLPISKVYKEVASGMNDQRKELLKMLESRPKIIIVEHKDRLTRFGFNYIETLLKQLGTEIIVINRDAENESDLIKDMISIVTSFCCRLYGLRRTTNKIKSIKKIFEDDSIQSTSI